MVTGLRMNDSSVIRIARATANTSWDVSAKKPDGRASATGASTKNDDDRGRHHQQDRCRQQQLPRNLQDLIHADADEAPANPRDEREHHQRLEQEPGGTQPFGPGPGPGAQEKQGAEE